MVDHRPAAFQGGLRLLFPTPPKTVPQSRPHACLCTAQPCCLHPGTPSCEHPAFVGPWDLTAPQGKMSSPSPAPPRSPSCPGSCSSSSTASLDSKATWGRCSWQSLSCSPSFAFPRAQCFCPTHPPAPRAKLSLVQHLGRAGTPVQSLASTETLRVCCAFMLPEAGGVLKPC